MAGPSSVTGLAEVGLGWSFCRCRSMSVIGGGGGCGYWRFRQWVA